MKYIYSDLDSTIAKEFIKNIDFFFNIIINDIDIMKLNDNRRYFLISKSCDI